MFLTMKTDFRPFGKVALELVKACMQACDSAVC